MGGAQPDLRTNAAKPDEIPVWTIGDIRITRPAEMVSSRTAGSRIFPASTADEVRASPWLFPDYREPDERLRPSIPALPIEASGFRLSVKTCVVQENDPNRGRQE